MAERITTPCKACHECWANFTLAEWDELQAASEHQPDPESPNVEARHCSKCGAVLTLDRSGLDDLDLTDDPAEYERHHPNAARVMVSEIVKPATKQAPSKPAQPDLDAKFRQQVLVASLRRLPAHVLHGIWLWVGRLPHEADGATLAELRKLRESLPR